MPESVLMGQLHISKRCWELWLSDDQPHSDYNGQWQRALGYKRGIWWNIPFRVTLQPLTMFFCMISKLKSALLKQPLGGSGIFQLYIFNDRRGKHLPWVGTQDKCFILKSFWCVYIRLLEHHIYTVLEANGIYGLDAVWYYMHCNVYTSMAVQRYRDKYPGVKPH